MITIPLTNSSGDSKRGWVTDLCENQATTSDQFRQPNAARVLKNDQPVRTGDDIATSLSRMASSLSRGTGRDRR